MIIRAGRPRPAIGGTVSVIYTIEPDGRATHCEITRSSGSAELDDTTCRLIERRFVFEPSRDRAGRPIRSTMEQNHEWVSERVERQAQDEPESRPRRRWPFTYWSSPLFSRGGLGRAQDRIGFSPKGITGRPQVALVTRPKLP